MTKKLNVDTISQELAGSVFFPQRKHPPIPEVPEEHASPEQHTSVNNSDERGVPPTLPLIPKVKRPIRQRQPFDIYEDQYQRLKDIAEAEKGFENGRSMSQMVRIALDNYFRDHGSPKK